MNDYKKVFVTRVINEDDGGMTVYITVATTKELAEADALETIRCWGKDFALPGEPGSIFALLTDELNLIEPDEEPNIVHSEPLTDEQRKEVAVLINIGPDHFALKR
jgi:hypothetical protein